MPCLCIAYGGFCRCLEARSPVALWGDEYYEAELAFFRSESPEAKAVRLVASAMAEELSLASAEAYKMATYAGVQGIKNLRPVARGARERAIGKVNEPCRWLYCDEKAPKSQWRKNEAGELCAPVLKALSGSQCWAHEYMDPKTKQMKKPHTCKRLHPNEAGWCTEWDMDRSWKPEAPTAADGFFSQRMASQGRISFQPQPHHPSPSPSRPRSLLQPMQQDAW